MAAATLAAALGCLELISVVDASSNCSASCNWASELACGSCTACCFGFAGLATMGPVTGAVPDTFLW